MMITFGLYDMFRSIKKRFALRSYGVEGMSGKMFFVEARDFEINEGRLLFKARRRLVAAVNAGEWRRVLEGIALEDFEK